MPTVSLYPTETTLIKYGGWLPAGKDAYRAFFDNLDEKVTYRQKLYLGHIDSVKQFKQDIEDDPMMKELFEASIRHAPKQNHIRSLEHFYQCLDVVISNPPGFVVPNEEGKPTGQPVGVPIYVILDIISNTGSAYDLFRIPAFNDAMRALLKSWGKYLDSSQSTTTLHEGDGGWFSEAGLEALDGKKDEIHQPGRGKFEDTYKLRDPAAPDRGYKSWNDFFTREILPSARSLPDQADKDPNIIVNPCESSVLRISRKVNVFDKFWLKAQNYSLYDMLKDSTKADYFSGGTVYQAFLGPCDYHRWRAPVAGTITRAEILPGTYYAALPDEGSPGPPEDPDLEKGAPYGALIRSQAWLSHVATRAIIYIEAENKKIGTVGFIAVGMVEVSSCVITVKRGDEVKLGAELGMFQFGGSSHTLLFRPKLDIEFHERIEKEGEAQKNNHIKVLTMLGKAV